MLNWYEESTIPNRILPDSWKSQANLNSLSDFLQFNWEQRSIFYDDGKLSTKQQFLKFDGQQSIHTNNYVGTIAFNGEQLNIYPKVFSVSKYDNTTDKLNLEHLMNNLIHWIEFCNRSNYPFISISSELKEATNLKEFFETLFLNYLKKALDLSPYYRYEDKEENLTTIRGHLDFKDYFLNKYPNGQCDKFLCRYSEFEFDNKLNRIFKYTCKSILSGLSFNNQRIARNILSKLNNVSDVHCTPSDCDGFRFNKLQNNFILLISMCKMFLLNEETSYKMDNNQSFCFLFPTEILFEGFIGGFIKDIFSKTHKVNLQANQTTLAKDIIYGEDSLGSAFELRQDILIEDEQKGIIILDTKYKGIRRFEGTDINTLKFQIREDVQQSDLYQIVEYASQFKIKDVYLLYPMYRWEDIEPIDPVIIRENKFHNDTVVIHIMRLPFVFEDNAEETKEKLRTVLNRIF